MGFDENRILPRRINPLWKKFESGCNINREVPSALEEAGFEIREFDTMYPPGTPKIAAYPYRGSATHARST